MDKFDWASKDFRLFEKAYNNYVDIGMPLFRVIDDIAQTMELSGETYFVATAQNCKDNRSHEFHFEIREDGLYHFIGVTK